VDLYYAHAMCLYGEAAERLELKRIRTAFRRARIVNPSMYDGHPEKRRDTVGFCLRLIEKCDAVIFSRLMGKVTAGVGKEVNHALRIGLPVFEIVGRETKRRKKRVRYISRAATIRLYDVFRAGQ
jgi:hypothetical protein